MKKSLGKAVPTAPATPHHGVLDQGSAGSMLLVVVVIVLIGGGLYVYDRLKNQESLIPGTISMAPSSRSNGTVHAGGTSSNNTSASSALQPAPTLSPADMAAANEIKDWAHYSFDGGSPYIAPISFLHPADWTVGYVLYSKTTKNAIAALKIVSPDKNDVITYGSGGSNKITCTDLAANKVESITHCTMWNGSPFYLQFKNPAAVHIFDTIVRTLTTPATPTAPASQ